MDVPFHNNLYWLCYYIKVLLTLFLGDILQEAVRQIVPGVKVGKILIQRDETSQEKLPKLFYKKFPRDIADCFVMLVDPMMATSG